jgi:N-acetylmuramoyl-L-alanine amidase
MPKIYLSPSTQQANLYVTGGSEEYWMNRLADALEPYLIASGIQFTRNDPAKTAASAIAESNAGNYDLHLALHSNAAPENRTGQVQGSEVYYYPGSTAGFRAAEIIADNLKNIYPGSVRTIPTTFLGEVRRVRAPSAFIELAYHDNVDDANFITQNIDAIAANIALSLTEYFGIPFITPTPPRAAIVSLTSGNLNVRDRPSSSAAIKGSIPNGAEITVFGSYGNYYVVGYGDLVGYAAKNYITIA